jgi:hypothetical protein
MKSQHRHELETNWLAHKVAVWLEKTQPYHSLVLIVFATAALAIFGFTYYSGATTARQSEAWNTYNQSIEGPMPNLVSLREAAEEYPDSLMQQFADVTWADGQVFMASRAYIQNRAAAMDALSRAEGTYKGLLQESDDEDMKGRAHFGLGRVYELRNELDRAIDEYRAVTGGFSKLAEQRVKDLEEKDTQETYAWLAIAQGPRRAAPEGPGTPGERPEFAPGELEIPAGKDEQVPSVDDLFRGIGETGEQDVGRYDESETAADAADAADDTKDGE